MTNDEREALIESVRRRRAMASLVVHALLDALEEARRELDEARRELRGGAR